MRRYFVTGGTGVVGSALIPVLLEDPHDEVWMLIRAADDLELSRRLDNLFRFWQLGANEAVVRQRLFGLRGDATLEQFGLPAAQYNMLSASVTNIVHAAGAVRMNLPLEAARHSAVGSARRIIELGRTAQRAGRLHKIEFVSTVGVGGHMRTVPEDWIRAPRKFHNTYEQSKAEAEDLIRRSFEQGLPVTVHRPSMVVGDSRTGRVIHFQIFYHLCEFLSGRRTFGLFPPLDRATLDIVPSDLVARVIAWSSKVQGRTLPVLHSASGPEGALPLPVLREVVRARLAERGERLQPVVTLPRRAVSAAAAVGARLLPDRRTRRALQTLPIFLDYLSSEQRFENHETRELVQPALTGNEWNWQSYLPRVLNYYLAKAAESG